MQKYYIVILGFILFLSCKEVYEPDTENGNTALVIQGLMTNIPGQLAVRITKAVPYDSANSYLAVRNANVFVYDDLGNMVMLTDNGSGLYENASAKCESGRKYFLKVSAPDGNIYESIIQSLPQKISQDSIYAGNVVRNIYVPDASGDYFKTQAKGMETFADLNSNSSEFPKVRYDVRYTVLYVFVPPGMPDPPTYYCWRTFNANSSINITSSKFEKTVGLVTKHNLAFFRTNMYEYDQREGAFLAGWLLHVKKYSLNTDAHQFYLKAKSQLEASGKIFDPVPSQILGNIKCVTDPKKLVFGFFEISYAEQLYYRYDIGKAPIGLIEKDGFPEFTNEGESEDIAPAFWFK
jgi:hypothetical protein